jgi:glycosyltransferase involved in cell wall biosynthesis
LRLLAIGRLVPVKQFEVAIEAVALANKRAGYRVAELVVAGDGPERGNLEALAQALSSDCRVMFAGWLEPGQVSEELQRSDALVLTSSFEPYGVVVLEAMAAGRPVLASDRLMAAIDRDEGTGAVLLHPSADVDCLASQIELLGSSRAKLQQASIAARSTAERWPPERAVSILTETIAMHKRRSERDIVGSQALSVEPTTGKSSSAAASETGTH